MPEDNEGKSRASPTGSNLTDPRAASSACPVKLGWARPSLPTPAGFRTTTRWRIPASATSGWARAWLGRWWSVGRVVHDVDDDVVRYGPPLPRCLRVVSSAQAREPDWHHRHGARSDRWIDCFELASEVCSTHDVGHCVEGSSIGLYWFFGNEGGVGVVGIRG